MMEISVLILDSTLDFLDAYKTVHSNVSAELTLVNLAFGVYLTACDLIQHKKLHYKDHLQG